MSDAKTLYATAKSYVQSTYLIVTSPDRYTVPSDLTFVLSYHLLLGFAVELYLKAYLLNSGRLESELRSASIRHNLEKLLELSELDGFDLPAAKKLVDYFSVQHANFEYRYMKLDSSFFLRFQADVFAELDELDAYVDDKVGASFSKGIIAPRGGWTVPADRNGWRIP